MANDITKRKGIAILGAAGGLGETVAVRLATRAPLTLGYARNLAKVKAVAERISQAGGLAKILQVDMTDSASVQGFFAAASEAWNGLSAIVSATGPAIPLKPIADVSDEDFRRIYETDVFGSFNVLRHGCAELRSQGGGSIVLFLTAAVLRTIDNDGMSGCPKTGVAAMLRQFAREQGRYNIRCNGIAPGVIDAGIVLTSFEVDDVARAVITDALASTPLGRAGKPEEIAGVVDFLTSDDASYVSGQLIAVDGGLSA